MMREEELLDSGLTLYKLIIDGLVDKAPGHYQHFFRVSYPDYNAPGYVPDLIELEAKIKHHFAGEPDVVSAWHSLTQTQKSNIVTMIEDRCYDCYFSSVGAVLLDLRDNRIVLNGIPLPRIVFGEFMDYDFVGRAMGYHWPEERSDICVSGAERTAEETFPIAGARVTAAGVVLYQKFIDKHLPVSVDNAESASWTDETIQSTFGIHQYASQSNHLHGERIIGTWLSLNDLQKATVNRVIAPLCAAAGEDGTLEVLRAFSGADIYLNDVLLPVAPYGKTLEEDYLRRRPGLAWFSTFDSF